MDQWGHFLQTATCNFLSTPLFNFPQDDIHVSIPGQSKQLTFCRWSLNVGATMDLLYLIPSPYLISGLCWLIPNSWTHHPSVSQPTLSPSPSEMCAKCIKKSFPLLLPRSTPMPHQLSLTLIQQLYLFQKSCPLSPKSFSIRYSFFFIALTLSEIIHFW